MNTDRSALIEKALLKAPYAKTGETAICGAPLANDIVLCIEYHTEGRVNVCDDYQEMTQEHYDWKKAGCTNNEEWHRYLNRQLWADYRGSLDN